MFIARRWSAVGIVLVRLGGLLEGVGDFHLGLAEDDARLLLALGLRLRDIASCSAPGMTMSRISTDETVTPQGFER